MDVVTRNKEITNSLLDRLGIPYECLSTPAEGPIGMAVELIKRWWEVGKRIQGRQIDAVMSISGISTSLPARLLGVRNVLFTDTEDASISNRIAFPFADRIYTPTYFLGNAGKIHRRYRGLHELSYLKDFDPDLAAATRQKLGIPDRYSLVRFVGNEALHDRDLRAMSDEEQSRVVNLLAERGEILISSAGPLPPSLEPLRLKIPFESIHAVMAGASFFIGESPTMAVEAGLLGVPSFLVSGRVRRLGNMIGLERDEKILRCFPDWQTFFEKFPSQSREEGLHFNWAQRAEAFRKSAVDVNQLVVDAALGKDD